MGLFALSIVRSKAMPKEVSIDTIVDKALEDPSYNLFEMDKRNQRCVIIDIDGTLADVRGGIRKNKKGEFDWENFFGAIPYYPTNEWAVRLTQIYYQMGFVVFIVTGRPDTYRETTEGWLEKYSIPYDFLFMRAAEDKRVDDVVKKEILEREFHDYNLIEFVLDDRPSVVKMWREEGLTCLQCNPHDFI